MYLDFEYISIEEIQEEVTYEPCYEDEEFEFDELEQHFATLCVDEVLESL
jgi:hypothetical protein